MQKVFYSFLFTDSHQYLQADYVIPAPNKKPCLGVHKSEMLDTVYRSAADDLINKTQHWPVKTNSSQIGKLSDSQTLSNL